LLDIDAERNIVIDFKIKESGSSVTSKGCNKVTSTGTVQWVNKFWSGRSKGSSQEVVLSISDTNIENTLEFFMRYEDESEALCQGVFPDSDLFFCYTDFKATMQVVQLFSADGLSQGYLDLRI
jgi:hypothetical protein